MECNNGHTVKVIGGTCPECNRQRQAAHRDRNGNARRLVQGLAALGVPIDLDHLAEGHRLLVALDLAQHPQIAK